MDEIEQVKKHGYSYDLQETSLDAKCVAVPIEKNEKVIAAMSVSVPTFRSNDQKLDKIVNILLKYKNVIESYFEYNIYKDADLT